MIKTRVLEALEDVADIADDMAKVQGHLIDGRRAAKEGGQQGAFEALRQQTTQMDKVVPALNTARDALAKLAALMGGA